jgi:Delta7-sterol 5-desaturase
MMHALSEWVATQAFHAPYWIISTATLLWFVLIYTLVAGGAYRLAIHGIPDTVAAGNRALRLRPDQVREELWLSALSIAIFAVQTAGVVWLVRHGWLTIDWHRSPWHLLWELPLLYVWNDVHFFVIHRVLHCKPLYRIVHIWHHRSVITTPFSAYSFHPVESFLLGSVMPLALLLHAFSPWALLGLTVMSLVLNVSGHLPYEQIHERSKLFRRLLGHSRYHNRHHREFHTHYAFSLAWLDHCFSRAKTQKP